MLFRRSKTLSASQASNLFAQGQLQLIDVREPQELAQASIPGALHIPLGQIPSRLDQLDRDLTYAFICRSGTRSAAATRIAAKAGLDAANVRGSMSRWMAGGLPLNTTAKGQHS
jgi:rhodanese-related sulfurtransferase